MSIVVESFPVGPLGCNCTILGDPESGKAIVVDPGDHADYILKRLEHHGLSCEHLLHTHAHLDHILATREMKERTGAKIHLHEGDLTLYEGIADQAAMVMARWQMKFPQPDQPLPVDDFLKDGDGIRAGGLEVEVLHTPGHTCGSCCFGVESAEGPLLVAGDTLFQGSIGRTDLPGGDSAQIVKSIRERIYTRSEETKVITGHGASTTIGKERATNAFVRPA